MTRQDSTYDQVQDVIRMAIAAGCYDAVDWILGQWPALAGNHAGPSGWCCDTHRKRFYEKFGGVA